MPTKIQWCDETWNPIKMRCTAISPGCDNCYARRMLRRKLPSFRNYPKRGDRPYLDSSTLDNPLKWRRGRRVFVMSMGDLFHDDLFHMDNHHMLSRVFYVMIIAKQHTFMILTKRPERMLEYDRIRVNSGGLWPRNVWVGVTAENQEQADKRIPLLLQMPAAVRFVSVEPMLTPVDLSTYLPDPLDGGAHIPDVGDYPPIDWGIFGPETGTVKRPFDPQWAWNAYYQFRNAGVPFFAKSEAMVSAGMPQEYPSFGGM